MARILSAMDFERIIKQLTDRGWTQAEIARVCDTTQGHISQIAAGKNNMRGPSYRLGCDLLMLERAACQKELKAEAAERRAAQANPAQLPLPLPSEQPQAG